MKNARHKTQAFTLIELLISSVLIAVVALAIYTAFSSGISLWARTNSSGVQKERLIILLERMAKELRSSIKFSTIDFEGTKDSISFPRLILQIYSESESSEPSVIRLPGKITYYFDEEEESIKLHKQTYKELKQTSSTAKKTITGVKSLIFSYYKYDKDNEEWIWDEEWSASQNRPSAIKIEITLKGEKHVPEETIIRTISLPVR